MARKFGSALLRLGAKKGDVMGMIVPNIPEFPIAFLGACGVGVTITTMNPTYRPGDITFIESCNIFKFNNKNETTNFLYICLLIKMGV
jgi:acyl-CoA synthetase (AMP-forming)/AMP-acid ligase II